MQIKPICESDGHIDLQTVTWSTT